MPGALATVARHFFRSNRSRSEPPAVREEMQMVEPKTPVILKVNYINGYLFVESNGKHRPLFKEDLKADFRAKQGTFDKAIPLKIPIQSSLPHDTSVYYCTIETLWLRNEQFVQIRLTI